MGCVVAYSSFYVFFYVFGSAYVSSVGFSQSWGDACQCRGVAQGALGVPFVGLFGAGLYGVGRLYGSGQLGDRVGRWFAFWLYVVVGDFALQCDGDCVAGVGGAFRIASDMDLAQACRARYSRGTNLALWAVCELAIIACDLAEVIGTAIALNLLLGVPIILGP